MSTLLLGMLLGAVLTVIIARAVWVHSIDIIIGRRLTLAQRRWRARGGGGAATPPAAPPPAA